MMTFIIPISRAQSVPGRSCSHISAHWAGSVYLGSITMSFAPWCFALSITCQEPRSRTSLTVTLSANKEGELVLSAVANNPNSDSRLIGLALAGPAGEHFVLQGASEVLLPGGSSHTWQAHYRPPANQAPTSQHQNQQRGHPVALVTPVPARNSAAGAPPPQDPAQPNAPSVPTPRPPQSQTSPTLRWDPRLTEMGITVDTNPAARWRLVEGLYEDDTQSGGQHNIFIRLLDENGHPCTTTTFNC